MNGVEFNKIFMPLISRMKFYLTIKIDLVIIIYFIFIHSFIHFLRCGVIYNKMLFKNNMWLYIYVFYFISGLKISFTLFWFCIILHLSSLCISYLNNIIFCDVISVWFKNFLYKFVLFLCFKKYLFTLGIPWD